MEDNNKFENILNEIQDKIEKDDEIENKSHFSKILKNIINQFLIKLEGKSF